MRAADVTTIKNVLLPSEHGASVMAGESLVAGLLIAASAKTFLLALGFVFLFLMTQPLKIAIKDMRQNVLVHRTKVAQVSAAGAVAWVMEGVKPPRLAPVALAKVSSVAEFGWLTV